MRCAYEASTRPARRASLAVSFLSLSLGGGFWLARRYDLWSNVPFELVFGAIAAIGIAIAIARSGRDAKQPQVENRDPGEEATEQFVMDKGSPFRAHARRVLLAAAPRISGRATALVVCASLAASAILLPASLKLPRWIEAELVLALWWVIVLGALSVLLYRGFRLRDDYVYFAPWDRPSSPSEGADGAKKGKISSSNSGSSSSSGCSSADLTGCGLDGCSGGIEGEGCLAAIVVGIGLAVAFGAAWVVVELAMPVVFLVMYWAFMRAIGRVANDRHGCEGSLSKSIGWGALWATIYVLPIAALTWALHLLSRK
jgi:lysylphosphatidylglycerol synthetase-like protein (DUF2156 family)